MFWSCFVAFSGLFFDLQLSFFPLQKKLSSRQAGRHVGFSLEEEDASKFHKSVFLFGVLVDWLIYLWRRGNLCPVSSSSSSSSYSYSYSSEHCAFDGIGERKREKELGKCSSVERRKKELLRTYRIAICVVVVDAWYFIVVTEAASFRR